MKKEAKEFQPSKAGKHFKLDKQTKRMLALSRFDNNVKLSQQEQNVANVKLEALTSTDFKSLMIRGQLADQDSKLTGMDDPLWKPAKEKKEGEEAGTSQPGKRKGKKALKMRKAAEQNVAN